MKSSLSLALIAACVFFGFPTGAMAADRVWTALVLATNETPAKETPESLEPFADSLREVFGYNSFYVLGEKSKRLCKDTDEWIVPSSDFFLHLVCREQDTASYIVEIDLYAKKKWVVNSTVRLARGAPLFIRGPLWGSGQLIYILEVR